MPADRTLDPELDQRKYLPRAARIAAAPSLVRLLRSEFFLYAAITLALTLPLCFFATLPLFDLPNHIARQHVLFGDGAPGASAYYAVHWRLIPNLAMEGGVFLLRPFVSVDVAVRIFVILTVAQLFLGAVALNRTLFGRDLGFVLPAALFAFNGPLQFGFINVCFGLGMALWVFALWLRWRRRPWHVLPLALLASLVLTAHLFAFGIYGLVVGCHWLGEMLRRRFVAKEPLRALAPSLLTLLHLALPLALYVVAMPRQTHDFSATWPSWSMRLASLLSAVGLFDPGLDFAVLLVVAAGAVLLARRITIAPEMRLPLLGLVLAYLALPHGLGEGLFVAYRVPFIACLFLAASTAWRDPADRARPVAQLVVVALLALRLGVMFFQWASWQPDFAQYRRAFAALPVGAKLLPLHAPPAFRELMDRPPLGNIAAMAVSERGALVPTLFANAGHQLLVYRPPYAPIPQGKPPTPADAPGYDYLLLLHPEQLDPATLPPYRVVARGRTFILGRILTPLPLTLGNPAKIP